MSNELHVFSDLERTEKDPSKFAESKYSFLNRSAWPACARIREIVNHWFDHYPNEHKADWKARFCSNNDVSLFSAFFELYCHEFCKAHGFEVEVHPSRLPVDSASPDFKLSRAGRDCCYFEATAIFEDKQEAARDKILDPIYDGINSLDIWNWFVSVTASKHSHTAPSMKRLLAEIKRFCDSHDPDGVTTVDSCPEFTFVDRDWHLDISLIPKKPEARVHGRRSLGITAPATGGKWCDGASQVLDKLSKKTKRYKQIELPLIVAVACNDPLIENDDFLEALVGDGIGNGEISTKGSLHGAKLFGIWEGPGGPKNQRLSAVLQVGAVTPWTIASAKAKLWHCPWPTSAIPIDWWRIPQYAIGPSPKTSLVSVGETAADILEVPANLLDDK